MFDDRRWSWREEPEWTLIIKVPVSKRTVSEIALAYGRARKAKRGKRWRVRIRHWDWTLTVSNGVLIAQTRTSRPDTALRYFTYFMEAFEIRPENMSVTVKLPLPPKERLDWG